MLYMGREYPQGYDYFRARCSNAFKRNKTVADPVEIDMLIKRGEFVVKELEALYYLKKYRTLKRRYYSSEEEQNKFRNMQKSLENYAEEEKTSK